MAQLTRITELLFRYSAVCRPHAYRDSNITERTGTRVAKYVTPVIIFSAIYNIPKFLEYKVSGTVRKCSTVHSDKNPSTSPGCFESKHRAILFSGHWSMLCLSFMGKPLMSSQQSPKIVGTIRSSQWCFPLITPDMTTSTALHPPALISYEVPIYTKLPVMFPDGLRCLPYITHSNSSTVLVLPENTPSIEHLV